MRASIVIAAHNEGDHLVRTVESCVETTDGLDCEIVVTDDASDDDALDRVRNRFPHVRTFRRPRRLGPSPTKDFGARQAEGNVLLFLDAHCKPEPEAIERLTGDVERLEGQGLVMPRTATLNAEKWTNSPSQVGYGYRVDLEQLDGEWIGARRLQRTGPFYGSPGLIGCCFAISRALYWKLRGFDVDMRMWGAEDVDLGLKAWMLGHPILCDPRASIGHRFQAAFDRYGVPEAHVVANRLRTARKHFQEPVWRDWVERCRQKHCTVWEEAWRLFQKRRNTVERERAFLMTNRLRNEFDYAREFNLGWPETEQRDTDPKRSFAGACSSAPLIDRPAAGTGTFHGRHRQTLVEADVRQAARTELGTELTLFLKFERTPTGSVHVQRMAYECCNNDSEILAAECLAQLIEGQPIDSIRNLENTDLLQALTTGSADPESDSHTDLSRERLETGAKIVTGALKDALAKL